MLSQHITFLYETALDLMDSPYSDIVNREISSIKLCLKEISNSIEAFPVPIKNEARGIYNVLHLRHATYTRFNFLPSSDLGVEKYLSKTKKLLFVLSQTSKFNVVDGIAEIAIASYYDSKSPALSLSRPDFTADLIISSDVFFVQRQGENSESIFLSIFEARILVADFDKSLQELFGDHVSETDLIVTSVSASDRSYCKRLFPVAPDFSIIESLEFQRQEQKRLCSYSFETDFFFE